MDVTSLPTPQVLVDANVLTRNLAAMQQHVGARGKRLRPHAKTHKSPLIARQQIERGAVGICCAKIGEAEVFANAGIADIRLPYPIHPSNARRLLALMDRTHVSIIVDHAEVAREWSRQLADAGRRLDVLVKVDVGFHRCGVDPHGEEAIALVRQVANAPGLRFCGLLSHAGHAYHAQCEAELAKIAADEVALLEELAERTKADGIPVDELSVGATPTARFSWDQHGTTEMRPGNYVYLDRTQVGLGAGTFRDCALTVLSRVVSAPAADRVILDAGSKTLTNDGVRGFAPRPGFGDVLDDLESAEPDSTLIIERLSEEHATVRVNGTARLIPGDLVRIVPNHACVVANMVDQIQLVDGLRVLEALPVAARGKIA